MSGNGASGRIVTGHEAMLVEAQLGRTPRGDWRTVSACPYGRPRVIETPPHLEDGTPFPTLYWLTCPWLRTYVDGLESAHAADDWAARLAIDTDLAGEMLAADVEYRERRARVAGGEDPLPEVGIAGQRDPLATKCLHAHVAAYLVGLADPVGRAVVGDLDPCVCPDDICAALESDTGGAHTQPGRAAR